ncbi:MAG: hypothetical protein Q8900_11160 [Bacillota bacterium]|nr:hypothetical protein [Bacillota bacterium]
MYSNQFPFCPYLMNQPDYRYFYITRKNTSIKFAYFSGTVTRIENYYISKDTSEGCYKLMTLESTDKGDVNFVISPQTYFVDHKAIAVGDVVTGFYNANEPVPLIYPPQYNAIVIAKDTQNQNVTVDYFNNQLISSDGNLKLNIDSSTKIILTNDQPFSIYPKNRNLIVVYGPTTKSIPAQTTPYKIVVLC